MDVLVVKIVSEKSQFVSQIEENAGGDISILCSVFVSEKRE